MAGSGVAWWQLFSGGSTVRSLAVLPLVNTAGDEDLEYLCDGIAESLIQQVSKLRSFRVRPLGVVLDFKGAKGDPQEAGRQLGVETVLAGTLERQVAQLLISARLVDVATGRQLWTSTYDRDAATLLDVQDEIAGAIMDDGLRVRLTTDERAQLVRHPTTDGDAYDLYLQARYSQRLATEEDYLFSRSLLESAVDPRPEVRVGLRVARRQLRDDGWSMDSSVQPTRGHRSAGTCGRPWQIDPTLPEAIVIEHAIAFLFDWDWAGAEAARGGSWRRRLAISIRSSRERSPWSCGRLARPKEALQLARRTRELDTRSPYLAVLEADYLLRDDQFDAAIALYQYAITRRSAERECALRSRRGADAAEDDLTRPSRPGGRRIWWPVTTGSHRSSPPPKARPDTARSTRHGCVFSSRSSKRGRRPSTCRRWTSREHTHRLARRSWPSNTSTPPSSTAPLVSCF